MQLPWPSDNFREAWAEWLQYRKERSLARYTPTGLKRTFTELIKDSVGDEAIAIKIIHKSIAMSYQGLFPLKDEAVATFRGIDKETFIAEIRSAAGDAPRELLNEFYLYWTQPADGKKMLFQTMLGWDTAFRLSKWIERRQTGKQGAPLKAGELSDREKRDQKIYDSEYKKGKEESAD